VESEFKKESSYVRGTHALGKVHRHEIAKQATNVMVNGSTGKIGQIALEHAGLDIIKGSESALVQRAVAREIHQTFNNACKKHALLNYMVIGDLGVNAANAMQVFQLERDLASLIFPAKQI